MLLATKPNYTLIILLKHRKVYYVYGKNLKVLKIKEKENMKKTNKNQKAFRININEIYNKMNYKLKEKVIFEQKKKDLCELMIMTNEDHNDEMDEITSKVDLITNELNTLINELCQYKKTDKVMNLAYSYISNELERTKNIIDLTNRKITSIECGLSLLINFSAETFNDTSELKNYVREMEEHYDELNQWKMHVAKYLIKSI